jgi:hypothetical protein
MPHTEWLRDGSTIYRTDKDGNNESWATFWRKPYDDQLVTRWAELARVAMNERPRLLAQRDELLAALRAARGQIIALCGEDYVPDVDEGIWSVMSSVNEAIRKAEEADREA